MAEISKTADHALALLLAITEQGSITPSDAARRLGINRTVAYRLLATLQERGMAEQRRHGFVIGPTAIKLASRIEPGLRAALAVPMAELAESIGETIVIHVRDGSDAVVLEQASGNRHLVRVEHEIASRHPLYAGASGRAMLAFLDRASVERVLRSAERPQEVGVELEHVRSLGYAISHDELQLGVHGIAAPIFGPDGEVVASAAILIPNQRASSMGAFSGSLLTMTATVGRALRGDASD